MKRQRNSLMELSNVVKQIEEIAHDIRAEIIANELIQNNVLTENSIMITNEGQFSRAYRHDVLSASCIDDNYNSQEYLKLQLSRDSIYDTLPEGFMHSPSDNGTEKSVNQMIREHKYQKKKEAESRNFFAPFENEIFHYRTKIENIERDFLYKLNGSKPLEFFYEFWGLSKEFPPVLVSKLIQLLPYAYKIVGDIELCCKCLSSIIEEPVSFKTSGSREYSDNKEEITLGDNRLGIDLICGNSYMDYSYNITIEIGPITKNSFANFINNGEIKIFIDCFYEHFFPMEVELKTLLIMNHEIEEFNFNKQPVLGYSTRI
jgi:hypothetical protein